MDYTTVLNEIHTEIKAIPKSGEIANYIPELAKVDPEKFGIHLITKEGENFGVGDSEEKFSIQSISKVFTVLLAFHIQGSEIWNRVGKEPSGNPFNSLVQLEYERGIPRNPFINSGALVICDMLFDGYASPLTETLLFLRDLTNNPTINTNPKVARSERKTGYRNLSLLHLMKSFGNIHNDVKEVFDMYNQLCSIEMSCADLAEAFLIFTTEGKKAIKEKYNFTDSNIKRLNAVMQTCGFYDEAGEFSFKVGLPGKSGVGGGIAAIHPNYYSVAVWSPPLNPKGNSYLGMKALELLTTKTALSIF